MKSIFVFGVVTGLGLLVFLVVSNGLFAEKEEVLQITQEPPMQEEILESLSAPAPEVLAKSEVIVDEENNMNVNKNKEKENKESSKIVVENLSGSEEQAVSSALVGKERSEVIKSLTGS
jgi:hypothetical protein